MYKKLFFFLLVPVLGISQVQIGQDIDGKAAGDLSGYSVSLSSDGSIVAIGAPNNNDNGIYSGHVRVYQNISGVWMQIGQDIDGEATGDGSGRSVSLSSDGSIIAIGAPNNNDNGTNSGHVRVYEFSENGWTQIGNDIDGQTGDHSGHSVSISSDGSIVAIGAPDTGSSGNGRVRVYEYISGVWTQIGQDINSAQISTRHGSSVSLSSDGSIVAIGAPSTIGSDRGRVQVYENISGVWTQIGQDIDGDAVGDRNGSSVSLSSDGSIVAIGATQRSPFSPPTYGRVQVYENISGVWTQIGNNIDGEGLFDFSGYSVSLSADGSIVVIGAPYNDGNGADSGHVRAYENILGVWTQIGIDIDGEVAGDKSGNSVSISANGSIIAIGALNNAGNGTNSGHVRIYNLKTSSANDFVLENFNIYPNPTSDLLNISLENNLTLEKVTIYNNAGQMIKEVKEATVDVSTLSEGIYFVEVTTNQGRTVKKVIVK